jgi:hypothetical protein
MRYKHCLERYLFLILRLVFTRMFYLTVTHSANLVINHLLNPSKTLGLKFQLLCGKKGV